MSSGRLFTNVRGVCLTIPWLAHLFAADLCLSALLPVSVLFPTFVYNASSKIAESVWRGIQLIFTRANKASITVSGSNLPRHESAIVVANHVSWTDFYMIQEVASNSGMLGRCRWFAKQQLKWVPFLGWGLWAMGMPLVSRNWVQDRAEMNSVFSRVVENNWPIWLISYSEATRYTSKKYDETVTWCREHDKPIPRHTLYPRTKGFVATVAQLRQASHVKAVYDCTIAYAKNKEFMRAPSFWETLSGPNLSEEWKFHIHVDRFPLEDLPSDDSKVAQWLENRWVEKGQRLEEMRDSLARNGQFIVSET